MQDEVAMYGKVQMVRCWCDRCGLSALVIDGAKACCDEPYVAAPDTVSRRSQAPQYRRSPPTWWRAKLLDAQRGRCFYCLRPFNTLVARRGKLMILRIEFDHWIPFAYSQNNDLRNYRAACNLCNAIKGDNCYATAKEARDAIQSVWEKRGYEDVCDMQDGVCHCTNHESLLQPPVSVRRVGRTPPPRKVVEQDFGPTTCSTCSTPFVRRRYNHRFCSLDCREKWWGRDATAAVRVGAPCLHCGIVFPKRGRGKVIKKFCTKVCRRAWHKISSGNSGAPVPHSLTPAASLIIFQKS